MLAGGGRRWGAVAGVATAVATVVATGGHLETCELGVDASKAARKTEKKKRAHTEKLKNNRKNKHSQRQASTAVVGV